MAKLNASIRRPCPSDHDQNTELANIEPVSPKGDGNAANLNTSILPTLRPTPQSSPAENLSPQTHLPNVQSWKDGCTLRPFVLPPPQSYVPTLAFPHSHGKEQDKTIRQCSVANTTIQLRRHSESCISNSQYPFAWDSKSQIIYST